MSAPVLHVVEPGAVRALPANLEAEQAVLGCVLYDNAALDDASDLRAEHFYEPFHARLWAAVSETIGTGRIAEPKLLVERFKADPAFKELGGLAYLADLVNHAPASSLAADYAACVHEAALKRRLVHAGAELSRLGEGPQSAPEALGEAEQLMAEIVADGPAKENWLTGSEVIASAIATARDRRGVVEFGTGLSEVDALIGGFGRGELSIIAGRPGMAKSIVASLIAKHSASEGKATAFFSKEMGREQLGLRLACDLAYNPNASVYNGRTDNPTFYAARNCRLDEAQWERLERTVETVRSWPLEFDTRPGLTVSQIEACARRFLRRCERKGIASGPIVVDHLGIIKPDKDRNGSMHAETADKSRGLAEMAKRLDVPVIALCQLNRGVEGRGDDKRPELRDLRNAGEIEEDARLVVFLYRPEYYLRPPMGDEDPAEQARREARLDKVRHKLFWIVAKANNGPLGQAETFCDVACAAVRDRRELWGRR